MTKEIIVSVPVDILNTPIEVFWCEKHKRWEWKDPLNKRGGIAQTLEQLKQSFVRLYKCPQCGAYHVSFVKFEGRLIPFAEFVKGATG